MKVTELLTEDRYTDKWAKDLAAKNRARRAAERAAAREQAKLNKKTSGEDAKRTSEAELWKIAQAAVDRSFPDGDPIDHLPRGIDMDALDKAIKMHAGPHSEGKAKYGLYDWLGDMWEDSQRDAIYAAKQQLQRGEQPEEWGPFFRIENGEVKPARNPWK